jgi:hypothetical protein
MQRHWPTLQATKSSPLPFVHTTMPDDDKTLLVPKVCTFQIQNHLVTSERLFELCDYAASRLLACRRAMVASHATDMDGFKDSFAAWLSWELQV